MNSKTTPILVILLVIAAFLIGMFWTKIQYLEGGRKPAGKEQVLVSPSPTALEEQFPTTIGRFLVTKDEICQENGKPIVYFFGGSFCPHCKWEHPIVEKVAAKFVNEISFHNNMDKQEADREIWNKYAQINQGGVPFLVLGCKYARVGSGETGGEEAEEKNLTALICKLTDGRPQEVCTKIEELTK